ncbi:MAG: response regulator, partial [Candidatus Polarisedimenticolia bacterium]
LHAEGYLSARVGSATRVAAIGAAAAPRPAAPKRTNLAVDDESSVLALARDILELHGYRVITARNGEEALRAYRQDPEGIDLILLDLTMPVMGGRDCLREILTINPRARVVIASGFSADSTVNELLNDGALDFVQKPYDIDALARLVREALDKSPPRVATSA